MSTFTGYKRSLQLKGVILNIYYFAYGSNMYTSRLKERVPSATPYCIASLKNYVLKWHKASIDGSGKCDIVNTEGREVWGVVYRLNLKERPALDKAEFLGVGYKREIVLVKNKGETLEAFTYVALQSVPFLQPYCWYHSFVLHGALEHKLPEHYILKLKEQPYVKDPDGKRRSFNEKLLALKLS